MSSATFVTLECEWCGGEYERREDYADGSRFCSAGCKGEHQSENLVGSNAPNWRGGSDGYDQFNDEWQAVRQAVLQRDGPTCCACGKPPRQDRSLDVHHIVPVRAFDDESEAHAEANAVALCSWCHGKWDKKAVQEVAIEVGVAETADATLRRVQGELNRRYTDLHEVYDVVCEERDSQ